MPLPSGESFDTGASLGIPALTAHLALSPDAPLAPGALDGVPVLVTGGAGAVGHAAIQLAVWAGATVITTVSGAKKAALAASAGAQHILNYREQSVPDAVRAIAPDGVPLVVDVSITHNLADDLRLLTPGGTVAAYADDGTPEFSVPIRAAMGLNARIRMILTYTASTAEKDAALAGVQAALTAGALRVGVEHGMPLTRFPLDQVAAAHDAVEAGTVGKVLIDVSAHV
jgi:NADPH:quinone reductase